MSGLDQIPISVVEKENRAMVHSILLEIAALLQTYLQTGERGELNLQSLPLSAIEQQALQHELGVGEVTIQLNTMGESEISETRFSGVWRVVHRDQEGRVVSEVIEVATVPAIVEADFNDMERALNEMQSLAENI